MRHRNYFNGNGAIDEISKENQEKIDIAIDIISRFSANAHAPEEKLPEIHFRGMLKKCNVYLSEPVLVLTSTDALYAVFKRKEFNDCKHNTKDEWFEYDINGYTGRKIMEKVILWREIPEYEYGKWNN